MKHTPIPYRVVEREHLDIIVGKDGSGVIGQCAKPNAAFIVKACNSHEALCAALNDAALMFNDIAKNLDPDSDEHAWAIDGRDNAREALRLAGEEV